MENSRIAWTNHTFNPWRGCSKVSPGCDHCYAEFQEAVRYKRTGWGPHADRIKTQTWRNPLKWNRDADTFDHRQRVFCASLADVWDNKAPQEWRVELFDLIDKTPNLDWLLLTKRPQNILKMMPQGQRQNVWLGTTVENQAEASRRIPILKGIPAVVRFLSVEPMLEGFLPDLDGIDWVICGGESGPKKRPFNPEWARDLRDHCKEHNVPFFMKQMDGRQDIPPDLMVREFPVPRQMDAPVTRQPEKSDKSFVEAAPPPPAASWFLNLTKAIHEGDTLIPSAF